VPARPAAAQGWQKAKDSRWALLGMPGWTSAGHTREGSFSAASGRDSEEKCQHSAARREETGTEDCTC